MSCFYCSFFEGMNIGVACQTYLYVLQKASFLEGSLLPLSTLGKLLEQTDKQNNCEYFVDDIIIDTEIPSFLTLKTLITTTAEDTLKYNIPTTKGKRTYCFWCRSHWLQHWSQCWHWHQRHTFLSAEYLVNQWLDSHKFSQVYNGNLTKSWLDFGDLDLIFKVTAIKKTENS